MATAPTYCTHRQLKDVFPQVDSFDTKRALYGWVVSSNLHQCHNSGVVTVLYIDGDEVTATENTDEPNANGEWRYVEEQDVVQYYDDTISDMNDKLAEAGEDFSTLITRITGNASRYLDSRLDPNLPQNQFKDKEGNYDYFIVRTTALIAASFMIRSHDATSEVATNYMEEVDKNIELLNTGKASLSWQTTGDSSKGVIRDVTYTSGSVRPVDLRGRASGVDYDLIKVSISAATAGVIGTAKYNVYVKDSSGLKQNQVVTEKIITGDYQTLAHGLEIRFGGSTDASVSTASNEWEVEVAGYYEEIDNANIRSIKATRGGPGSYGKYNRKSY